MKTEELSNVIHIRDPLTINYWTRCGKALPWLVILQWVQSHVMKQLPSGKPSFVNLGCNGKIWSMTSNSFSPVEPPHKPGREATPHSEPTAVWAGREEAMPQDPAMNIVSHSPTPLCHLQCPRWEEPWCQSNPLHQGIERPHWATGWFRGAQENVRTRE